ncbi:hypothetical protein Lser_V15G18614 [Lactuca serriola]
MSKTNSEKIAGLEAGVVALEQDLTKLREEADLAKKENAAQFTEVLQDINNLMKTVKVNTLVDLSSLVFLCRAISSWHICWAFSIYLEAVAILPQLVLLQRSGNVDNLIGQYVFFLGAYCALNILNWICRYLTQPHFNGWISCFSGLIQTTLYADFFYYYFISWKSNSKLQFLA